MATVTIKIDNKIKMDRGHMNLRAAHQEQFISSSNRKTEREDRGSFSFPLHFEKQSLNVAVFTKSVL